jgi:hemerythrin
MIISNSTIPRRNRMSLITWNEAYSVKIKKFDDQHKQLISMLNTLHDAMREGKGKDVLEKVVAGLVDYTKRHFADEESFMKQYGYPDYEKHKKEHNLLTVQVSDLQKDYSEGKAVLTTQVMMFLKDWLQEHIKGTDKTYGPFFNGKGVL